MFGRKKHSNLLKLYAAEIKDEVLDAVSWHRRLRRRRFVAWLTGAVWFLSTLLVILIINILVLLPSAKRWYGEASSGRGQLEQALILAEVGDWPQAAAASQAAVNHFSRLQADWRWLRYTPVGWLPLVRSKVADGRRLIDSGLRVSQVLKQSSDLAEDFLALTPNRGAWNFSNLDSAQGQALIKLIAVSQPGLERARDKIRQTQVDLALIKNRQLLLSGGLDLDGWQSRLSRGEKQLSRLATLAKVLPILAGYPEPTDYLFVLQNNDELRPTGGFIGAYGLARVNNGVLENLSTNDVYHLDMPVKDKLRVAPPAELKKYLSVNNWYLRDANWSPDWPTAAQKIMWFYQQENFLLTKSADAGDFDIVIGVTPSVMMDLLKIAGPVKVNGQVYNEQNLQTLLQDTTERDYADFGLSSWDRKSVIGDLTKALQTKLLAKLSDNWERLLNVLSDNLDRKNLLIYANNPVLTAALGARNWQGEIRQTAGDYLMVVDANLAALKTDAVVNKSLSYQLGVVDGGLVARVQINYANRGRFSWKTTRYRTYTRIYVPEGSQLLKAAGFSGGQNEVTIGRESGKAYFGAFIEVEPGKMGDLFFEYKLPYNLYALYKKGEYSLLLQKQPGSRLETVNFDWQFDRPVSNFEPAMLYTYSDSGRFRYQGEWLTDKFFTLKFE